MDPIFISERSLRPLGGRGWEVGRTGDKAPVEMLEQKMSVPCPHPLTQNTWSAHRPVSRLPVLASLCLRASSYPCFAMTLQPTQQARSDDGLELVYKHLAFSLLGWATSETCVCLHWLPQTRQ